MKVPTRVTPSTELSARPLAQLQVDGVSPAAFGAGIGEGLSALGQGGLRLSVALGKENEEEKKTRDFAAQKELVRRNTEWAIEADEHKRAARPDGLGTRQTLLENFDKKFGADFMKHIPADRRAEYDVKIQTLRSSTDLDGYNFEKKAREANANQTLGDELNSAKGAVEKLPDSLDERKRQLYEMVDKAPLDETTKQAQKRAIDVGLAEVHYKAKVLERRKEALTGDPTGAVEVFLSRVGAAESENTPGAKNSRSSAGGRYQFIDSTWANLVQTHRPDIWSGLPGNTPKEKEAAASLIKEDNKLSEELLRAHTATNVKDLRNSGFPVTPGTIYLAHFLGVSGAKAVLAARPTADISTVVGTSAREKNPEVFAQARTPEELINWAKGKMSEDSSPGRALPQVSAARSPDGYWRTPNIDYDLQGKTRAEPVSREYAEQVSAVLESIQPGLRAVITSGGQVPGEGVGSHRHDVDKSGHAGTSDFVLHVNGKPVRPAENKALYAKVIEQLAAQGFTGIGHYAWGLHVGNGARAFWGPDKTAGTADSEFKAAAQRGWAMAGDYSRDTFDTDARYGRIPYERRFALRADAERTFQADMTVVAREASARDAAWKNEFFVGLTDGKLGQASLDSARAEGKITAHEDIVKAQKIIDSKKEEVSLEQEAITKYQATGALWDAANSRDKALANVLVGGEKGRARLAAADEAYVAQVVLPFTQRTRIIPTDVSSGLTAMLQSKDPKQVWFAYDALSQMEKANPQAYETGISAETQRDVEFWKQRKDYVGQDDLLRSLRGGDTPEERKARVDRRREGETLLAEKKSKLPQIDNIVNDIVREESSIFQRVNPDVQLPFAMNVLERQVQAAWLDAYSRGATEEQAKEIAAKEVKRRWGVTTVGGIAQFMELPPTKTGYQALAGGYDWITKQIRSELKLTPGQNIELLSDNQTAEEFRRWQKDPTAPMASYRLFKEENGIKEALRDPKNPAKPLRMNFAPLPEDHAREVDYMQARSAQVADEAFFKEYMEMTARSAITGRPIPRDITEEYELRRYRRDELQRKVLETGPQHNLEPIMEFGPGGIM